MLYSRNSLNVIFLVSLSIALFTTLLAIIKLTSTIDEPTSPLPQSRTIAESPIGPIYHASPFLLPITWSTLVGILIWKGKTKSFWTKQGYDYDVFKVVARMRGSPMRVRLLKALNSEPKNKLQLAKELEVDWKTIEDHIEMLEKHRLVKELGAVGKSKFYITSEHGRRVLSLLSDSNTHNKSD